MKILMIAYATAGYEKLKLAAEAFSENDTVEIETAVKCKALESISITGTMADLVRDRFSCVDAIVFFSAAGIAVRTIAPLVRDKFTDPAVVVIDETAKYCISLLSGHVGGANRLCGLLAAILGAEPVVTTATDREGLFSVDVYAKDRGLVLTDRKKAKEISARILNGETIRIYEGGNHDEAYPACICKTDHPEEADIVISDGILPEEIKKRALRLVPRTITAGIGCRRGVPKERIMAAIELVLEKTGYVKEALAALASIDVKKDESGIIECAKELGIPFHTYTAEELLRLPGTFSTSAFVASTVGVDCVCERSAVMEAGGSELLCGKTALDGVTAAIAKRKADQG